MALTQTDARFEPDLEGDGEVTQRRERLARQMAAVRRRSRRIRTLRFWIPAVIVLLAALNIGWIAVQSVINSFNVYTAAVNEIRMTNPRFFGQSAKGDRYSVSGLEALRRSNNTAIFILKSPSIDYHADKQGVTHISAANGIYNRDTQEVTLNGNVVVAPGGSQMVFRTEQAVVDLTKSEVHGDKHIEGNDPLRHIEGESFTIGNNGHSVSMAGRGDTQFHYTMKPQ